MSKDFDEDEALERVMAMSEDELDAELERLSIDIPLVMLKYKNVIASVQKKGQDDG